MQHPSKPSVLVIEDDPLVRNLIADIFEYDPYELSQATTGAEGLAAYARLQPDLVICDIHLPDMLGLDICRVIKQRAPEQLFVFLTGAGGETDQVVGLEIGADDYIVKPLVAQVFRARIRALLRRIGPQEQPAAAAHQLKCFGALTIDTTAYQAFLDEQELNLTHKEFELLWWLASHPGQLFTRQRLLDQIWQDNLEVNERSVDALIRRLREKLGEDGQQPRYIETIRGMGYRFKAE
ncbi:MAG: response regulator transcription factor [Candidatus Sericytochromatia bacterium]